MENKYFKRTDYEEIYRRCLNICPNMKYTIEQIRSIKPPKFNESKKLLLEAGQGNISAKNRLIEMHLRIALKYALYKAERHELPLDGLFSDAVVGLIEYAQRYSMPNRYSLKNYIIIGIQKKLKISVDNALLHKSRFISKNIYKYYLFNGDEYFLNLLRNEMLSNAIDQALTTLTKREKSVLELKFALNGNKMHLPKEIAEKINCHKLTARRIVKRAIKKLSDSDFRDVLFDYWMYE